MINFSGSYQGSDLLCIIRMFVVKDLHISSGKIEAQFYIWMSLGGVVSIAEKMKVSMLHKSLSSISFVCHWKY